MIRGVRHKTAGRRWRLAVLLMVLAGYATFSVHAATHTPLDDAACQLCAGHGSPAHAVPMASVELPSAPSDAFAFSTPLLHERSVSIALNHARGPPATI